MIPKSRQNTEECNAAKTNELQKLKDFETYKVVEDTGQKHITSSVEECYKL